MDLGRYVATIEANIKNFESNIDKAEGLYKSFAEKQLAKEKQRFEAIKKVVEQETGIRVTSAKEIESATKNYNNAQISNIKKLANAYVTHGGQIEGAEKSRARQAEQASARVQKSLKKEQESVEALRKQILQWSSLAITVPIVFGTKKAMQDFVEFQNELYNVKAVTNATNAEMAKMTQTALEMSETFSKSGKEIATAFLQLGQAGYDASEILTSAKDVMLLSAAGMKDIDFTAELVVTTLKAFGMQASESSRVVDIFSSSAAKSVSSLDKISASLKYTAGLWGSQNWELEELVGLLDVLFDTGVRGEKAGRLLASAINGLQKPSSGASKEIEKLFGNVNALSPAMNDVTSIVKKLASANATTEQIFKIFGKESSDIMLRLIQNVDNIDKAIAEVTGQSGETARQAYVQMQSLGAQWDILKNKSTSFTKQVIGALEPMLVGLVKSVQGLLDVLNKIPDWLKTLLALAATFTAFAPPVALAAVKLSGFAVSLGLVKGAAITAGIALRAAFPILAGIGVAISGIAIAYGNAQKKHQQWVDDVTESIGKLKDQKKSLNDMIKSVSELYDTVGDTKDVRDSLYELANIFPYLREAINKNAGDTAGAMSVLYKEVAKLNKENEKMAKSRADTANTTKEKNIAEATAKVNKELSTYNSLLAQINGRDSDYKGNVIDTFGKALNEAGVTKTIKSIEDVKTAMLELYKDTERFGEFKNILGEIILGENGRGYDAHLETLVLGFEGVIQRIASANVELRELQRTGQMPVVGSIVVEDKPLQRAIVEAIDNLEKKYGEYKVDMVLGIDSKDKMISDMGSVAREAISSIVNEYSAELSKFGIFDESGQWSKNFKAFLPEAFEKVSEALEGDVNTLLERLFEAKKSLQGKTLVAGADDLGGYIAQLDIVMILAEQINEKTKAGVTSTKEIKDLNEKLVLEKEKLLKLEEDMPVETRDIFRQLMEIYFISQELSKKGGAVSNQLDWWGKIKKEIEDIKSLLEGDLNLTSLTETMNGFETKTGEGYKRVVELGTALATAFEKNPRLKWYAENFDIVNGVVAETTKKLEELELQQLRNAGIDTSIPEFIRDLKNAGDKVAQLKAQMEAIEVTPVPLDLQTVRNTIDDLRAELESSTPLNVDILLANAKEHKSDLVKLGFNDNEVNEELVKIYGKQVAELLKQEAIEKSLEEKYDSLKDKYGEGVVSLISKAEYNKAKDAEEALLVSIGKMSKEQAEANKAFRERNKILADNEAMNAMIEKAEEGKATYEELNVVWETLGKDTSFSGLTNALIHYNTIIDATKKNLEELKKAREKALAEGDTQKASDIDNVLKGTEASLAKFKESTADAVVSVVNETVKITESITNAIKALKNLDKSVNPVSAAFSAINPVVQSLGTALAGATNGVSSIVSAVFSAIVAVYELGGAIASIFDDTDYTITPSFDLELESLLYEIDKNILNYPTEKYLSLGESIGSALTQGIGSGTLNIKEIIRNNLFTVLSAALIESMGFEEKIKKIMEKTKVGGSIMGKAALSDQIKEQEAILREAGSLKDLQKQIDKYEKELKSTDWDTVHSQFEWWEDILGNKTDATVAANATHNATINEYLVPLKEAKIKAEAAKKALADLKKQYEEYGDVDVSTPMDLTELEKELKKAEDVVETLLNNLGEGANLEKLTKNIRSSLQEALVGAALTGSYSDFKKAVYNILVSNITEALMSSAVIGARVQGLVAQVLNKASDDGTGLTMNDVKDILDEIQNVWKDVTNTDTPIGSLLMGLRSGLAEFGGLEVSVNPGQVVTALPSEAMNKLDLAFQEVASKLSQAISEAGLNSHIDLVNITTAYIERMTANTVTIGSAVFDMSGDLVLNNINGDSVGEFLENVIKEQVEASLP